MVRRITSGGAALYFYRTKRFARFDTPQHRLFQTMLNGISAFEREQIVDRTDEVLEAKARLGASAGGRCFGYTTVRATDGMPRKEWVTVPAEARIVVNIFERAAAGDGPKTIASTLNRDGVRAPRSSRWGASSISTILCNERYRGWVIWGRTTTAYEGGALVQVAADPESVQRVHRPEVQIVSDALWTATEARRAQNRALGRHDHGGKGRARYLLTGIARCAECGGGMQVAKRRLGRSRTSCMTFAAAGANTAAPRARTAPSGRSR